MFLGGRGMFLGSEGKSKPHNEWGGPRLSSLPPLCVRHRRRPHDLGIGNPEVDRIGATESQLCALRKPAEWPDLRAEPLYRLRRGNGARTGFTALPPSPCR